MAYRDVKRVGNTGNELLTGGGVLVVTALLLWLTGMTLWPVFEYIWNEL